MFVLLKGKLGTVPIFPAPHVLIVAPAHVSPLIGLTNWSTLLLVNVGSEITAASILPKPVAATPVSLKVAMVVLGVTTIAALTAMSFETWVAAEKVVLPAWSALTEQVPALAKVKEVPLTEQTEEGVALKLTANDELLVADSVIGVPTVPVVAGLKVMVWAVKGAVASPPPQAASKAVVARAMPAKLI